MKIQPQHLNHISLLQNNPSCWVQEGNCPQLQPPAVTPSLEAAPPQASVPAMALSAEPGCLIQPSGQGLDTISLPGN